MLEGFGGLFGAGGVAAGDGGDLTALAGLHAGNDPVHGNLGNTQHSPSDFAHGVIFNAFGGLDIVLYLYVCLSFMADSAAIN